jgi:hypothetical protein
VAGIFRPVDALPLFSVIAMLYHVWVGTVTSGWITSNPLAFALVSRQVFNDEPLIASPAGPIQVLWRV